MTIFEVMSTWQTLSLKCATLDSFYICFICYMCLISLHRVSQLKKPKSWESSSHVCVRQVCFSVSPVCLCVCPVFVLFVHMSVLFICMCVFCVLCVYFQIKLCQENPYSRSISIQTIPCCATIYMFISYDFPYYSFAYPVLLWRIQYH
jgi:hypothetical protein